MNKASLITAGERNKTDSFPSHGSLHQEYQTYSTFVKESGERMDHPKEVLHALRAWPTLWYYRPMVTLEADIQQKQKEIEEHKSDLFVLYADLGRSVALIEQMAPLGYATDSFNQFVEVQNSYNEANQMFERVQGYISQMQDRSRKIKQIEADFRQLNKKRSKLYAQLGAVAYEAYASNLVADYLREVCAPIFEEHQRKTSELEAKLAKNPGLVPRSYLNFQLDVQRSRMVGLFTKAGEALAKVGVEADFPGIGKQKLFEDLKTFLKKEQALMQELEIHRSAVAKLQSEEAQSPKARLDASSQAMKTAQKDCERAASNYGKVLYETLPESISAQKIGAKSIALMSQITLHRSRIRKLEAEIKGLANMIKVQELEAQIELENQKIAVLQTQIEGCNRQISQVKVAIQGKRKSIEALLSPSEMSSDE